MRRIAGVFLSVFLGISPSQAVSSANEVLPETPTLVHVRQHPGTGKDYAVILDASDPEGQNPFAGQFRRSSRPDYRLLDHRLKKGDIPYDGPVSDRRRVYLFAGALALSGLAAGTLMPVASAVGTGSAAGAGAFAAGGTAVSTGSIALSLRAARPDPNRENFVHETRAVLIRSKTREGDAL